MRQNSRFDKYFFYKAMPFIDRHQHALKLLPNEAREASVVDIGCGDGVLLKKLHSLGYRNIAGIDFSSSAVEKLQALNIFPVHHIDLDSPNPFVSLNKKYEYGLLVDVLEHMLYPVETLKKLKALCDVLIIVVPNFNSIQQRWQCLLGKVPSLNKLEREHVNWVNFDVLHKQVHEAGYVIESTNHHYYAKNRGVINRVTRLLGKFFPRLWVSFFAVRCVLLDRNS